MNEEAFRSLNQVVSAIVSTMSNSSQSVGTLGPLFDPNSPQDANRPNRSSRRTTKTAGAKPVRTFIWSDEIGDLIKNPSQAPDGTKVKFDKSLSGDAMEALLKREIPEIGSTR